MTDLQRSDYLQRTYGIDIGQYACLLKVQGDRCALCGATDPGGSRAWQVDHDHVTGRVRGLLCIACNSGLGKLKDSVEILKRAIVYLLSDFDARKIVIDLGDILKGPR